MSHMSQIDYHIIILQNCKYGYTFQFMTGIVLLNLYAFVKSRPGKSHVPDQICPPPFGQGRGQTSKTVVLVSSTFCKSFCGSSNMMTEVVRNLDVQGNARPANMYGSMAASIPEPEPLGEREAFGLLPLFTTWWDHRPPGDCVPFSSHSEHYCAMFDFLQFHCDWHSSSLPFHFQLTTSQRGFSSFRMMKIVFFHVEYAVAGWHGELLTPSSTKRAGNVCRAYRWGPYRSWRVLNGISKLQHAIKRVIVRVHLDVCFWMEHGFIKLDCPNLTLGECSRWYAVWIMFEYVQIW